ncbi:MAG TPA: two-component regulator propeller domain-containing protein [Pyrinomonadaceae bacterium]
MKAFFAGGRSIRQPDKRSSRPFTSNALRMPFVLLLVLVFAPSAATQNPADNVTALEPTNLHQWGAVTLFHGLPSNRVRAIAQDAEGAMWFGTDGGLAKYDGRRTQAITADGLPQGRVLALRLDAEGALWVGTEAGATRLAGGEFRPVLETAGQAITAIIAPERGRVLLSSEQGMIFDCRTDETRALNVRRLPEQPLTSVDVERPGRLQLTSLAIHEATLYAGTRSRGLLAFTGAGEVKEITSKPRAYFVEAMEVDSRGHLWHGAKARNDDSGLYEATDPWHPVKVGANIGTVTTLRAGANQDLWVGTDGRGALRYVNSNLVERFTFEGTAGGLRSDHVYSIFVDNEEVVWFGTDRGVCRYDPHGPHNEKVSDNPESNFVRTLYRTTDGRVLCGTNRGLFAYEAASAAWQPVEMLAQKTVYAISEEEDGRLLVGTAGGIYVSQRSVREFDARAPFTRVETGEEETDGPGSIRAIARFQGATYIATFGRGVERLDGTRRTLIWPTAEADAGEREVISLHADGDERLCIGTANAGVFMLQGGRTQMRPELEKLRGSAVRDFDTGSDGWLWLATSRGLYVYRAGELSLVVPDLDARNVVAGRGPGHSTEAWCATAGGGLVKVALDAQLGVIVSRLDAEQGLPSQNVFAVLPMGAEQSNDALLIGTNRGVSRYEPGHNPPTLQPTRIISKRIHPLEELRGGLQLEYPQNSLVLDVVAMSSRTFPEQFQYAFQLYDGAGHIIKQKFSNDAQFTMEGLRPGRYHVVARAFTRDLIASAPLQFDFNVASAPFPWTTTALSVLLALSLVALWWGYLQNRRLARTGSMLSRAISQLADARLQLANETEAERRRIARDLHDQTLADLRHLLLLTDQLPTGGQQQQQQSGQAAVEPALFRREIESISKEIRRICEDLSPSVLENVGLTAALEWAISNAVAHAAPEVKFEYAFNCEENLEERLKLAPATQMQIYRIAQEAISNICRHAAATRVELHVMSGADESFIFRIEDNGKEFEPRERKRKGGRGLANIRARASLIEAEVAWSKRAGGGTVFTLRKANAVRSADAPALAAAEESLHSA